MLIAGVVLAFALVATRLVVLELSTSENDRLDRVELDVQRISRDAASLLVLSQEYLARHSLRANRQWRATHRELAHTLTRAAADSGELLDAVSTLGEVAAGLTQLFDAIEAAGADGPAAQDRRDLLADHLLAETRRISDGAFELGERVAEQRRERIRRDERITRVTMAAFAVLVILMAVFIGRRVLRPMVGLETAARAVSAGALDARTAYRAGDEFGDLSRTFDTMAEALQERTAHLEGARRDLRNILDAIPSVVGYWDRELRNRFANHAYQDWFGLDPAAMPGVHLGRVLGDRFEANRPHIEGALRGEPQVFERSLPTTDGGERNTSTHYLPDVVDGEVRGFYAFVYDVTQQTQDKALLAAALRENEALLTTIRLHAIFSVADRAGRIIEANDNFCRITGYSREELLGQNHRIVNSGVQDRAFWVEMWHTIASGRPWRGEVCNRAKDGSLYWVDSIIAPFIGADGQIEKYISIRTDITAAKLAEQKLQTAHGRFAIAADSASIGVWEWDVAANTLLWDDRTYQLYGQLPSGGAEPYSLWVQCLHPEDRVRVEGQLGRALRGEGDYDPEFRIRRPDGETRHIKANARVIRDAAGAPLRLTGVNIDITERKRAELALVQTSSLLRTVLESASEVSIIATDPDLNITIFNRGAERLLGYRSEEMVGRATPAQVHDAGEIAARGRELSQALGRTVEGGAVFTEPSTLREPREWTYVRKDGSRVRVSLVVTAMQRDDGELFGYLGIAHDVTRQAEVEESLRVAIHKARQASRAKSQFLANMSHEIRTPMNAVIGLSYLLGQTTLDEEQADFLAKIRIASKALLSLINDVLDLSKVEAGELTIESTPFSPAELLSDVAEVVGVQAKAKGIRFGIEAPDDLPTALQGDAMRLTQVLMNLLSNAVKFTERGSVSLSVRCLPAAEGRALLRFAVRDSGIGIAPAVQARLFAPFVQADASMTRRFGGTGLGLSIVKTLVELMGGRIDLRSQPGVGSEFAVELAFALAEPGTLAPRPSPAVLADERGLPGVRVLVVDDSDINLDVAKRILELQGARVDLARDGLQACEQLQRAPRDVDVVLMDVQMPVLDGYQATRRIRSELGLAELPIIALTAGALTSERERAIESGMNAFVTKPFDPRELMRIVLGQLPPAVRERIGRDERRAAPAPADADAQTAAWPSIDGIDLDDVRTRLGDDVQLFRSMLERLLREFTGLAAPADPAATAALAGRLHKLRGSAGMLGATTIHRLASDGEAACRADDLPRVHRLVPKLAAQLRRLEDAARPFFEASARQADEAAAQAPGEIDPGDLLELERLLREQSLSALKCFSAMTPALRGGLGREAFDALHQHMENLQFDEAARLLERVRP